MDYKEQLLNIKQYLINEGVDVDEVTMWQGGFYHDGYEYGLEIIATITIGGKEKQYYVPKHLTKLKNQLKYKFKIN